MDDFRYDLGVRVRLRKCEKHGVIIMLEFDVEYKRVIIKPLLLL